jgi:hypothetical protein
MQVGAHDNKFEENMCGYLSESLYAGNLYLKTFFISRLNDYYKTEKTPESGLSVQFYIQPNRGTGHHCRIQFLIE